jgi:hypothetical protein
MRENGLSSFETRPEGRFSSDNGEAAVTPG